MSFQEITSQSPFEDNLVTKEPNLPQTYTFFFEINKNNYKNICIPLPFIKSFQGYKLDNLWDNNKLCYTCNRNEDNFNYPITNNKQTLAFANEGGIPIPPNTFIILDELKGFDTITFQCASSTNIKGCLSYSNSNICIGDQDIEMEIDITPKPSLMNDTEKSTPMVKRTINNKKIFVPEKIIHWIRNWGDCGINGRNTEIVTEEISSGNFMVGDQMSTETNPNSTNTKSGWPCSEVTKLNPEKHNLLVEFKNGYKDIRGRDVPPGAVCIMAPIIGILHHILKWGNCGIKQSPSISIKTTTGNFLVGENMSTNSSSQSNGSGWSCKNVSRLDPVKNKLLYNFPEGYTDILGNSLPRGSVCVLEPIVGILHHIEKWGDCGINPNKLRIKSITETFGNFLVGRNMSTNLNSKSSDGSTGWACSSVWNKDPISNNIIVVFPNGYTDHNGNSIVKGGVCIIEPINFEFLEILYGIGKEGYESRRENFENTIITDKNKITSSISCSGKSCLSFFPPDAVSLIKTDNNEKIKLKIMENLQPCSGSSFNLSEGFPACSDNNGNPVALCVSGNPTFHYMVYIPNSYRNSPTFDSNSIYQKPKIFKSGFYNHGNFLATLSLLQSSIQKGNNLPEGTFAIYEVSYNLTVDTSIQFQIMDFLSLQNQLSGTFSNWFKKTKIYNSSLDNMKKLIQNFCNSSPESALCIEKMKLPNLQNQIETFEFPKESNNRTNYIIFIVSIILIILLYFRKLY